MERRLHIEHFDADSIFALDAVRVMLNVERYSTYWRDSPTMSNEVADIPRRSSLLRSWGKKRILWADMLVTGCHLNLDKDYHWIVQHRLAEYLRSTLNTLRSVGKLCEYA